MLPVFKTENSPLQIYFLELHMEILMQQLLNNNQKYVVGQSFFMSKNYFIKKKGLWLQSCKMTGYEGAWTDYTEIDNLQKFRNVKTIFKSECKCVK